MWTGAQSPMDERPAPAHKHASLSPKIKAWLLDGEDPLIQLAAWKDPTAIGIDPAERTADSEQSEVAAMQSKPVAKILRKQTPDGYWGLPGDFYMRSKYKGTVWSFILLAELGVGGAGADPRVRRAADFLFGWSQDRASGGFAYMGDGESGGRHDCIVPCLTGNLTWAMLHFGLGDDPRTRRAIDWIARYLRFDDGATTAPKAWPYRHEKCYGKHACMMGVVKCLKALAEIPEPARSQQVHGTIASAVDFLLQHRLFKSSHDAARVANEQWLKPGFPRFWKTDIIEMLGILTRLGIKDARMQDAVDVLVHKRTGDGAWLLEDSWNGRMHVTIEKVGAPSRWLTLEAIRVLNRWDNRDC